jgi:hypothetical protein
MLGASDSGSRAGTRDALAIKGRQLGRALLAGITTLFTQRGRGANAGPVRTDRFER